MITVLWEQLVCNIWVEKLVEEVLLQEERKNIVFSLMVLVAGHMEKYINIQKNNVYVSEGPNADTLAH